MLAEVWRGGISLRLRIDGGARLNDVPDRSTQVDARNSSTSVPIIETNSTGTNVSERTRPRSCETRFGSILTASAQEQTGCPA
jgi:hypothetical protein